MRIIYLATCNTNIKKVCNKYVIKYVIGKKVHIEGNKNEMKKEMKPENTKGVSQDSSTQHSLVILQNLRIQTAFRGNRRRRATQYRRYIRCLIPTDTIQLCR
uniref:Uncharacterized protein n=1 Tax=Photinus pyralis TaxID=7054 RepID=A0A1Y1K7H3_PHOPY